MGLLDSLNKKAQQQWAQNLTLAQIEEYERQGMDMSEYRIQYEERKKQEQELVDAIALDKLDAYKKTRSAEDPFLTDVVKFNGFSEKEKATLELAPLVYGRVVQAHGSLFKPCKTPGRVGIVFLFALDDAHRYDMEWLAKTANRISEMKESVENQPKSIWDKISGLFDLEKNAIIAHFMEAKRLKAVPEDCRKIIGGLRDEHSHFCFPLGASLSEGAEAWCSTYVLNFEAGKLPFDCIPHNRIIPFLLAKPPKEIRLIPPKYYTK
ncbi:hypothetical protein FACS18945_2660 [Bacteroidia bacterium]|nr:hypothetical protein FACS18945_2660 [Bacteroidia bacterium]